ncbi:MAG: F0F1 ATP synthase subunit epsilon [Bifidobacteriaceae bacterium]|jgi:F-type H+-transporting ATPase subunit epsilon|nr:F0F1 ATP synthase subunit epsilon [Bifidobacteriaceae bacterium]
MDRELTIEIADWEGLVWGGAGQFFVAPTVEGSIGVYPRHEPLLALLGAGDVRVSPPTGPEVKVRITGGFLSIDSDIVTVVADEAELVGAD